MQEQADALADAIEAALPGWVERCVARVLVAHRGRPDPGVMEAAAAAGREAQSEVGRRVRRLLEADIDDQRTTPLSLLRAAVAYPTAVLRAAGVPPVERDEVQQRLFPDDVYDLSPANFADVDPSLAEPGLVWGAAKAHAHLRRHRAPEEPVSPEGPPVTRVAAYVPDLMDRSRMAAAAGDVAFVARPGDLASVEADVVVVDLTRPGVLEVLPGVRGRVIGFANHTERRLMEAARVAGCDQVLARSAFFARVRELLAG